MLKLSIAIEYRQSKLITQFTRILRANKMLERQNLLDPKSAEEFLVKQW